MEFLSIKEYFYKLNTIGFILLLLPIGLFIFLYFHLISHPPIITDKSHVLTIAGFMLAAFLIALTIVHWVFTAKIRRLKRSLELANKMDGFFRVTLIRMAVYSCCSLVMAAGFFLTGNAGFTAMFILLLLLTSFQWPSPASFCRHLGLGHIERDMIMNNRDLYQRNKGV